MQLARGAAKTADRFLRARGLQKSDRDDVIADAMLWCWTNRASYSLTTTLETWFMNAVRDAYKALKRNELPSAEESLEGISGGTDETYEIAAAESSARALIDALTPAHKKVAVLTMQGYTREEILEVDRDISKRQVDEAHQRIRQLRKLLPDLPKSRLAARIRATSSDNADDKKAGIDMELENNLDAPPQHGKECKPCIHCNWWEFSYQEATSPQVAVTADQEVLAAQRAILARKIEISSKVERSST
jgi:DNA-directed RNA polymerase specialized sigma24 family protein